MSPKILKYTRAVNAGIRHRVVAEKATRLVTRATVAEMLGVSPNTVTRWVREGRLPSQLTLGGHHRFDRDLVEQLRESLYQAPRPPDPTGGTAHVGDRPEEAG